MGKETCQCGFGEEYFTFEEGESICTVCGGKVAGHTEAVPDTVPKPHGKQILVVDDQQFFRKRVQDLLIPQGHDIIEAGDGLDAISHIARTAKAEAAGTGRGMDLVILDLHMPGLIDGFQTLGVIKAIDEALPVIILTSSPPTQDLLQKLGRLKAKKYLNKASKDLEGLLSRNIETLD